MSRRAQPRALSGRVHAAATTAADFMALGTGHIGLTRDFGFNIVVDVVVVEVDVTPIGTPAG
jgi:hypothetical protein